MAKKKVEAKSLFSNDDLAIKNKKPKNGNTSNINTCASSNNHVDNNSTKSENSTNSKRLSRSNKNTTKDSSKSSSGKRKGDNKIGSDTCKSETSKRRNKAKEIVEDTKIEIEPQKIKVGRKDRKHNWWPGCDYVWVDGIDHWVSKTAFKQDNNKTPIYTLSNYVQGLDSYWVMRYKSQHINESHERLKRANEELNTNYKTWGELSTNSNLSEEFVIKYENNIAMLVFLTHCREDGRKLSNKFLKRYKDKVKMLEN